MTAHLPKVAVPGSRNNLETECEVMGEYIPPQEERDLYILVTGANRYVN